MQAFYRAAAYAAKLESDENLSIVNAVARIYADAGNTSKISFFQKNVERMDGYAAVNFFENYFTLLKEADEVTITKNLILLRDLATNMGQSPWRRFGATKTLNDMRGVYLDMADKTDDQMKKTELEGNAASVTRMIEEVKSKETNDQLKAIYSTF